MAFGSVIVALHEPVGTQMHVLPVGVTMLGASVATGAAAATVVATPGSVGNPGNVTVVPGMVVAACLAKTIVIHEYTVR